VLTNKRTTKRGIAMHQAFQDCIVELEQLLRRTRAARGEFSKRTDRAMPGSKMRFQVRSKACNCYNVVEVASGNLLDTFSTWKEAVNFAQHLEAQPNLRLVQ
jgi:hypothetical protein